jgi:shikimate-5-dehydrogenase
MAAVIPASINGISKIENAQKNFYIFGQGISFSMSPVIHTAAFRHHGLPHTYEILQTSTVDELAPLISSPTFGGSSVTMPHKLLISKFCDDTTDHAKRIGAVNTLIVSQDPVSKRRKITGDNTDWSGLVECLKVMGDGITASAKTGLVIGAGGASRAALYALHMSGIKDIYLVNRTRATAEQIANDYASLFKITVLSTLSEVAKTQDLRPDIIIGTIPADKTSIEDFPTALFAKEKGICVDMAYKPRSTPLLKAAGKAAGWKTVTGVEVLLEQAFDQSQLWLGLPAPKSVMVEELERADAKEAAESLKAGKL